MGYTFRGTRSVGRLTVRWKDQFTEERNGSKGPNLDDDDDDDE
jgi:hypothetical protein